MHENNSTVEAYISFIKADTTKMSLEHEYIHEALLKLIEATKAMAEEIHYEVKADLDTAKKYADEITKNPLATTHADNIRKAAEIISTSLQDMQQAKYPQLSVEAMELKNASDSINPHVLTLNQKEAVSSFFQKAADLLNKMN